MTARRADLSPRPDQATHATSVKHGYAFGFLASLIWGWFLVASRYGVGEGLTAADIAFLRYATAGLIVLPWLLRNTPHRLAGVGWVKAGCMALFAGPPFILLSASGYLFAPLAHAAVVQLGALTLFNVLLASIVLREHPSAPRLFGLTLVVVGLIVAAGPALWTGSSHAWIGDLLFGSAGLSWAIFTVLQRQWGVPAFAATASLSLVSALIYAPAYLLLTHGRIWHLPWTVLAEQALAQGVFSGVIAIYAFSRAVAAIGASRSALFPATSPGVAILLGIPVTGEIPSCMQVAGLLVLSAGLLIPLVLDARKRHLMCGRPER
ncbi:MAG TPA: DMT family transporter [Acidocella sp.]|uniref:DMT family transporter n=1 Tax=Acidocella sp. TaxID=50710 RepID=UPI002CDB2B57|nr:DMT family transporter [Acidocella sp.]HVE22045.1 DMT family transporter [Acidocella sp.]